MSRYFRRDGTAYADSLEWAKDVESDHRIVGRSVLPDGKIVSTVWLGLDHQFGDGPPLIFETMVFPNEWDFGELACERYSTEEEAQRGHARYIAEYTSRVQWHQRFLYIVVRPLTPVLKRAYGWYRNWKLRRLADRWLRRHKRG